jgi:hypothetical protein
VTYAPRYALFALVGIAGEDDLDAPDLQAEVNADGVEPTKISGSVHSSDELEQGQPTQLCSEAELP